MASVREQILQAVELALSGPGKPAGVSVHRYRTRPFNSDALPALVIYPAPDGERVERVTLQPSRADRTLTIRIECRLIAAGEPPDTALDPLLVWVTRAIMADPTLGGLAVRTTEVRTLWDAEELDRVYAAAAVDFQIEYRTDAVDQETRR